jgi:hypothetical protein
VHTIHCHFCGGVVRDRATIEYRPPRSSAQVALPQMGTCTCTPPIVYQDSPLDDPPSDDEPVERVERVEPVVHVEPVERVQRHKQDAPARLPDPSDPWKGAV